MGFLFGTVVDESSRLAFEARLEARLVVLSLVLRPRFMPTALALPDAEKLHGMPWNFGEAARTPEDNPRDCSGWTLRPGSWLKTV